MSRPHAELVAALSTRWNEGERSVTLEDFDPAFELESPFAEVAGEPYRGYAGLEQWMRDLDEQFAEWQTNLEDVREVGDRVIGIGGVHGRGRASGIEFDVPAALVAEFGADDRITRARIYTDVNAALQAVGLDE
jgi:ketosteroid isomerase-like protein